MPSTLSSPLFRPDQWVGFTWDGDAHSGRIRCLLRRALWVEFPLQGWPFCVMVDPAQAVPLDTPPPGVQETLDQPLSFVVPRGTLPASFDREAFTHRLSNRYRPSLATFQDIIESFADGFTLEQAQEMEAFLDDELREFARLWETCPGEVQKVERRRIAHWCRVLGIQEGERLRREAIGEEPEPAGTPITPRLEEFQRRGILRPAKLRVPASPVVPPRELMEAIARAVVAPEATLERLSLAFYEHGIRSRAKGSLEGPGAILIIAPTASGKTALIREAVRASGIKAFTHVSAPAVTGEGIVGLTLGCVVHNLLVASGEAEDVEVLLSRRKRPLEAERGILCLDEICKLVGGAHREGTFAAEVMNGMLRILDGAIYNVELRRANQSLQYAFDTSRLLTILAGAFEGIEDLIARRLGAKGIGFHAAKRPGADALLAQVTKADLLAFGLPRQLVGRIRTILTLPSHSEASLASILASPTHGPLAEQKALMRGAGIDLRVTPAAVALLAQEAHARSVSSGMGARVLRDLLEEVLGPVKFQACDGRSWELRIDADFVRESLA